MEPPSPKSIPTMPRGGSSPPIRGLRAGTILFGVVRYLATDILFAAMLFAFSESCVESIPGDNNVIVTINKPNKFRVNWHLLSPKACSICGLGRYPGRPRLPHIQLS